MNHKRVLAIHDISCVGRCSLTVALPIISSAGIECSVLPTAVLSTHTGGFTGFTYRDLTEDMMLVDRHWSSLGLKFDAVYTGFLGSFQQIDLVKQIIKDVSSYSTTVYVDPVMADKGKLYSVFGPDFPAGMRTLCESADVIMPNVTELCMMLGQEYTDGPYSEEYIDGLIDSAESFGADRIVITGVSFEEGYVGAVYKDYTTGEKGEVMRQEIPGYYHGTGDVFGSALVGACESGLPLGDAVSAAVDLTVGSIRRTMVSGEDVRYGVDFEPGLADYAGIIRSYSPMLSIEEVTKDDQIRIIASMASTIWPEAFRGMEPDEHLDYLIKRYQSFEGISDYIRRKGYTYLLVRMRGESIGYMAYSRESDHLFLSKFYLLKQYRGKGLSKEMMGYVRIIASSMGYRCIRLTTNRMNETALAAYKSFGFQIVSEADVDMGDGHINHDYNLELML